MGVISNEKADLAIYQLKDVAQTWYTQWKDNRALRAGPKSWEIFVREFFIGSSEGINERKKCKNLPTFVKEV